MARSLSCRLPSWQPENETLLRAESSGRSHGGIRGPSRRQTAPRRTPRRDQCQRRAATLLPKARPGTLKAWAEQLSLREAGSLLDETLEEEKKTDEALSWRKPRSTKRLDRPRNDQWPQLRARTSVRQNTFACPAGNCRELSG
jgi:Domain of unknown function (DUF892)